MKDSLKLLLLGLFIGAAITVSLFSLTRCMTVTHEREPATVDTVSVVVVHDTIVDTVPVPVESRQVGTVLARLPIETNSVCVDDSCQHSSDSCQHYTDVLIPLEQHVYTDSANYRAVISGYRVSLDTLAVFRQREYITQRLKPPEKRWGLSVGVGAVVGTDMRVRPGLFVGGTYTFVTF